MSDETALITIILLAMTVIVQWLTIRSMRKSHARQIDAWIEINQTNEGSIAKYQEACAGYRSAVDKYKGMVEQLLNKQSIM